MKIVFKKLRMTKVHVKEEELLTASEEINGYLNYFTGKITYVTDNSAKVFIYDNITNYEYIKIVAKAGANGAPNYGFFNGNNIVGQVSQYNKATAGGDGVTTITDSDIPQGANKLVITDKWSGNSNQVEVWGMEK